MIFITGPLYSGKRTFVRNTFGEAALDSAAVDVHLLAAQAEDLESLADSLAHYSIVIASETGCGVVPVDRAQREARENAGRLACLLSQRAQCVVRMCCGIPQVLKGELPCTLS